MTVKMEPSYVGDDDDADDTYEMEETWKAIAELEITRKRPIGETCTKDGRFGWCETAAYFSVNDPFKIKKEVVVRVRNFNLTTGSWEFKLEAEISVEGGIPLVAEGEAKLNPSVSHRTGTKSNTVRRFDAGEPQSITRDVLQGKGIPEEDCNYHSPLQADTKGKAKAYWIESNDRGYTIGSGHKEIEDPAEVSHVSPNKKKKNDVCSHSEDSARK